MLNCKSNTVAFFKNCRICRRNHDDQISKRHEKPIFKMGYAPVMRIICSSFGAVISRPNLVRAILSRSGTFISSQRVFSRVSSASRRCNSFSFLPISRAIEEQREFIPKKIISMMNAETMSDAMPMELVANLERFLMRLFLLISNLLA